MNYIALNNGVKIPQVGLGAAAFARRFSLASHPHSPKWASRAPSLAFKEKLSRRGFAGLALIVLGTAALTIWK